MSGDVRSDPAKEKTSRAACDILTYLADHPHARDDLEGIAEWWLLERTIRRETEVVRAALMELVERGLVIEEKRQNSPAVYHVNPKKTADVKRLTNKCCGKTG